MNEVNVDKWVVISKKDHMSFAILADDLYEFLRNSIHRLEASKITDDYTELQYNIKEQVNETNVTQK